MGIAIVTPGSGQTQILAIDSTTTPALVTGSANATLADPFGRPRSSLVHVTVTRAVASAMTGVVFALWGSRLGTAGTWVPLLSVKASDAAGVPAQTWTVSASAGTTAYDALMTENLRDWPFVQLTAQAVGHDAVAGDSAAGYVDQAVRR